MTLRTPQCQVFWALLSNSKHSGVLEDSKSPTLEVLGFTPHTWPKWGCDNPSFFPSLTSPSSLAPFSVSLIYIFLVSFSSSHVIGLFNMCSNVHTTAYMQLLDFFLLPNFFANLHLKYMISNFNLFEGFFMENKWSQIG
jgi:hypothetical protein